MIKKSKEYVQSFLFESDESTGGSVAVDELKKVSRRWQHLTEDEPGFIHDQCGTKDGKVNVDELLELVFSDALAPTQRHDGTWFGASPSGILPLFESSLNGKLGQHWCTLSLGITEAGTASMKGNGASAPPGISALHTRYERDARIIGLKATSREAVVAAAAAAAAAGRGSSNSSSICTKVRSAFWASDWASLTDA